MAHRSAAEEVRSAVVPVSFTTSILVLRIKAHGAPSEVHPWLSAESWVRSASRGTTYVLDALLESQFVAPAAGQGCAFVQGRQLRREELQAQAVRSRVTRLRGERPISDA